MNVLCPACSASISVGENAAVLSCPHCGAEADLSQVATSPGGPLPAITRDLTGTDLGEYHLDGLIGVGGMGVVYKARRRTDDQVVAVKVLGSAGYLKKQEFIARFKREVKALERLHHPSIVQILDSGEEDGTHFLVTEYVPGVSLAEHIRTRKPPLPEILRLMGTLAEAIAFAHRNGIVHRDIKPANVLVHGEEVKVLDFGLAQITGTGPGFSTLTRTDLAMGTFNYLSPEQRTNAKGVDERSDVFSLGVVLFEVLTGTLPLGNFAPPSALNRQVGKRLDKVVERSLRSDPDLRYPSAESFAADLARAEKPVPLHRLTSVRVGLAAILALVGAAAAWGLASPPSEDVETEQGVMTKDQRSLSMESTKGQAGERRQITVESSSAKQVEMQGQVAIPMNPPPAKMDNPPPAIEQTKQQVEKPPATKVKQVRKRKPVAKSEPAAKKKKMKSPKQIVALDEDVNQSVGKPSPKSKK